MQDHELHGLLAPVVVSRIHEPSPDGKPPGFTSKSLCCAVPGRLLIWGAFLWLT